MIVVVESNFVLELALRQEEAAHCERIVALANEASIQLAVPGCSLFEPYETLVRRTRDRDRVAREFQEQLIQLARSDGYTDLSQASEHITRTLSASGKKQLESLASTLEKLLQIAHVIPLDAAVGARSLAAQLLGLSPQDSFVFASVERYLQSAPEGPRLFANKNRKDFATESVEGSLEALNCKLIPSFLQARRYIESIVGQP